VLRGDLVEELGAPTITVLPLARRASARASPMPPVPPGMKMVFPEMFMLPAWPPDGGPGRER